MTTPLNDFARYVRPDVPGCPEVMVLDAIVRTGIEFCKRTKVIKETIIVTTVINQALYPLVATGGLVDEVLSVRRSIYDYLDPSSAYDFERLGYGTQSGDASAYYLDAALNLVLGNIPNTVESLTAEVRTIPLATAVTLPGLLGTRYLLQIAAGAKSMLMMQPKKEWSDPQMAGFNQAMFEDAIAQTNLRDAKGGSRKPLRTKSQQF